MLKLKGVKKVASESKSLNGWYSPEYLQLLYNHETGEVWTNLFSDLAHSWKRRYDNEEIIDCGIICDRVTMADVRAMVERAVLERACMAV